MGQLFKTVQNNGGGESGGAIHRVFDGQLRVCSVDSDKNYEVELLLLNPKVNANGWQYMRIEEHTGDVADTPILFSTVRGDHAFTVKKDAETGRNYASFTDADSEHPVGWIPKMLGDSLNPRIVNIDGTDWLSARGFLPKFYNKELIDELERSDGKMAVSIETIVTENRIENDVEIEEKYSIVGTTILRDGVNPAVKGANIRKLSVEDGLFGKIKLRAASLSEQVDFNKKEEPQTQKTKQIFKGERRTMKKVLRLDDMQKKFPDYTVLGMNGLNVALLSNAGRTYSYTFLEDEDTVIPERITEIAVNSTFGEGDGAIEVPAETLVEATVAQLNATKTALEKQVAENAELTGRINAMETAETKRRKELVKNAIEEELHSNEIAFNTNFGNTFCADMLADEQIDVYAKMEDTHGFCGDTAARCEVNDRCIKEMRKQSAEKVKTNAFTWNEAVAHATSEDDDDYLSGLIKKTINEN